MSSLIHNNAKIICVEDKWPNKSPDENKSESIKRGAKIAVDVTKSTPAQLLRVELCRSPSTPLLPFIPSQPSSVSHTWPEPFCQLSFMCNNSWDTLSTLKRTREQLDQSKLPWFPVFGPYGHKPHPSLKCEQWPLSPHPGLFIKCYLNMTF